MKFIYPAIFSPTSEGGYEAIFPDLEFCHAQGDTLDEAVENAHEAANEWLQTELAEDVPQFPPVSDLSDLSLKEGETARNICVTLRFYEGWDE
ncbi:MAG: type II toxin-antitoxin system HicB family antitoxin [Blautia sp.]|nr:type II toxin-antitoxin system HicB family antitoxin [Blautia sp.]